MTFKEVIVDVPPPLALRCDFFARHRSVRQIENFRRHRTRKSDCIWEREARNVMLTSWEGPIPKGEGGYASTQGEPFELSSRYRIRVSCGNLASAYPRPPFKITGSCNSILSRAARRRPQLSLHQLGEADNYSNLGIFLPQRFPVKVSTCPHLVPASCRLG